MNFPKWAPPELVKKFEDLKPKAQEEYEHRRKLKSERKLPLDWKTYLEGSERFYTGRLFVGQLEQLNIILPLIRDLGMESVWKNLEKRKGTFKPVHSLFGGKEPAPNLFAACVEAEMRWLNLPKRTKAESKRLHEDIASLSLQLCELMTEVFHSSELSDARRYIDPEKWQDFIKSLEHDGHDIWRGFDGYLNHLFGELIPPVPKILLMLHKRALEEANNPQAVSQPKARSAKLNFFIDQLSTYFHKAYGSPLYGHVATIVSALFNESVDNERVRALLRSRKAASKARTRKKIEQMKHEISG